MIFSQYTENCEVIIDNTKIGGDYIEDYAKKSISNPLHANIYVHSRILIADFLIYGIYCLTIQVSMYCENIIYSDSTNVRKYIWRWSGFSSIFNPMIFDL